MRTTHTFAKLELSKPAYDEVAKKLREAGYDQAFHDDGTIDMHGIGVVEEKKQEGKVRRVLLLTSYCGNDNPNCNESLPCLECLQMCNIAEVYVPSGVYVAGGWDNLNDQRRK